MSAGGEEGAEAKTRLTYCRLCEALCGLSATVEDGRITHIGPDRNHVASQGHLCVKGVAMTHIVYDPDRVLTPLKRVGGPGEFERCSWEEALETIATRMNAVVDQHGGDGLGVYFGNPATFGFRHMQWAVSFARRFGSSKIYNPVHVDTGAKSLGCAMVYGEGYSYTFPDLEDCDFLLILGANPMVSHMSLVSEPRALQKLEAVAKRGAVVVVDPRRTETARRFEHIAIPPDTDAWLLVGLLKTIFEEGMFDEQMLDARVSGWRDLREALATLEMSGAAARCRLPVEQIQSLARRFAGARTAACYGRIGTNRGTFPTLTNVFIECINIVTGRLGQRGGWRSGMNPFASRQARPRAEATAGPRSRIGNLPMLSGSQPGGTLADDILTAGPGQLRALFVDSGNPVMAYPAGRKLERALQQLDLLVGMDFYINETNKFADFILPATTFLERPDTVTDFFISNAPRPWLQFTDAVIAPRGESRMEPDIFNELLVRTGRKPLFDPNVDGVMSSIEEALGRASEVAGVGELSVARMRAEFPSGLSLPDAAGPAGTWERIKHADGKPQLWNDAIGQEIERLEQRGSLPHDGRLRLFGRRKLRSLNSWMHNDLRIVRSDVPTLLMHPADALERRVGDGQLVELRSDFGRINVEVQISDDVIAGAVSYPHGWGHAGGWKVANGLRGVNINELASGNPADWEQISGMCLLDGIPVDVIALAVTSTSAPETP
jgi:anaerobic selenocysteine-containing dehydrogenase